MAHDVVERSIWTPYRIEKIRAMWVAGRTAADIGAAINVGRNAVIGKIYRMGLSRTKKPRAPKPHTPQTFRNKTTSVWTDDRVAEMRRMWMDHPTTEIAAAIGMTASAVMHKAHRLRLHNKNQLATQNRHMARRSAEKHSPGRPPTYARIVPVAPDMRPVTLFERTGCAFPINDGGPFLFCNHATAETYCEFHKRVMVKQ